tara:strand:+ start:951 stop:1598 length:648 start_codon:yes stop_codon:yes gene_type:complete
MSNLFITFLIIFLYFLIINNFLRTIKEGLANKSILSKNKSIPSKIISWPNDKDPPLTPPHTQPFIMEKKKDLSNLDTLEPKWCGCINYDYNTINNKNTLLLKEVKKRIETLTSTVKKSDIDLKKNTNNIANTKKDDYNMCCEAGPDEREDDGEGDVRRDRKGKRIYGGLCYIINRFKCPIPPKKGEDEDEAGDEAADKAGVGGSASPTQNQILNG